MNKLLFNTTSYDVAVDGISVSTDVLITTLVSDDFDGVEATVAPVDEIIQELEDGTKVASYYGYTKLMSIEKKFHQVVDYDVEVREEEKPKLDPTTLKPIIDPETGKIVTEIVEVTYNIPIYADVLLVTLFQPTLEDTVAEQGEEITELQEALAEMI